MPDAPPIRVAILGSTGSIGTQTIGVIEHLNRLAAAGGARAYEVVALASGSNAEALEHQARSLGVSRTALADTGAGCDLQGVLRGADAAEQLVRDTHAEIGIDVIVGAIVGNAGLGSTLAAAELGIDVALANKEPLVAAGGLVTRAARSSGAKLLPVDSEHAALWQCLRALDGGGPPPFAEAPEEIERLVLTASGGSLRSLSAGDAYRATPDQALRHPTWNMGPKVTVDCASLTNKAFELMEAHWLFAIPEDRLEVLIHPDSIVHAFVEFRDATTLAQIGSPDMMSPIQHALTYPERLDAAADRLDLLALSELSFSRPDPARFPALDTARWAMREGGTAGAIFNGANEAGVEAFLDPSNRDGRLPFGKIAELVQDACSNLTPGPLNTLDDVNRADVEARAFVAERLHAHAGG